MITIDKGRLIQFEHDALILNSIFEQLNLKDMVVVRDLAPIGQSTHAPYHYAHVRDITSYSSPAPVLSSTHLLH